MPIPYGRQDISESDIDAVVSVLRSDYLTQGPAVPAFEQVVAARVGAKHALAVNSATSALHIACLSLGLGEGDLLWTTPNTFVASANCARYCGADVDFVDIDAGSWNLSLAKLEEKLIAAKQRGRLPKIVVPVHFAGQPTAQEAIWKLGQTYGFRIIEDASHAIGASFESEQVGSCKWSDITIFSFHPVKIVTTGEGGMALTNSPELAEKMGLLRSHGITRDASRFEYENAGPWYYEQQTLGFNYRLTDIQAALGKSQMDRLDTYVERRNQLARRYDSELSALPLKLPAITQGNRSAFHLYIIRVPLSSTGPDRLEVFNALREAGIQANLHYLPVHLQPYYRSLGFTVGQFPEAELHSREAISLPLFPTLSEAEQDHVITQLKRLW